jgi:hypothetical protein
MSTGLTQVRSLIICEPWTTQGLSERFPLEQEDPVGTRRSDTVCQIEFESVEPFPRDLGSRYLLRYRARIFIKVSLRWSNHSQPSRIGWMFKIHMRHANHNGGNVTVSPCGAASAPKSQDLKSKTRWTLARGLRSCWRKSHQPLRDLLQIYLAHRHRRSAIVKLGRRKNKTQELPHRPLVQDLD